MKKVPIFTTKEKCKSSSIKVGEVFANFINGLSDEYLAIEIKISKTKSMQIATVSRGLDGFNGEVFTMAYRDNMYKLSKPLQELLKG